MLSWTDRRNWQYSVGNLNGFDFRDEDLQCYSVNQYAHWNITGKRKEALRKSGKIKALNHEQSHEKWEAARKKNLKVLHKDIADNPITDEEWETAIAWQAIAAHRQGEVLLAVAPDLKADKAESVMMKTYHYHQQGLSLTEKKQRARSENWLDLILAFEADENSKDKAKSQVFARFRRVIDAISFS